MDANFHPEDLKMMFSMSHFISSLSRPQREEFASILSLTYNSSNRTIQSNQSESHLNYHRIPIPTTKQELRSLFYEGKNAIFPNLPHPEIYVLGEHMHIPSPPNA